MIDVKDDFEEFAEPDDLYQSLPLDKLEALELLDAVPIAPPATVVKEKVGPRSLLPKVIDNALYITWLN